MDNSQFSYTLAMDKKIDLKSLNVKVFARERLHMQGERGLSLFPRLSDLKFQETEISNEDPQVSWNVHGECLTLAGGEDQFWLHLQAVVLMPQQCQRCMSPMQVQVSVQQDFRFVADEATAAMEDEDSEEDVLVLSSDLDVWELMEDELIMTLPLVPKHSVCPTQVPMSVADEAFEVSQEARPNPFAALAKLKQNP
jgi:uncharacterized protein